MNQAFFRALQAVTRERLTEAPMTTEGTVLDADGIRRMTPAEALAKAGEMDRQGRPADAEDVYRRIVGQAPGFHPAYQALALLAYRHGKLAVAVDLLESAIALAGDVAIYHRDRGEMCRRLGRLEEAVTHARRAVALAPDDAEGHYNLGLALADSEEEDAALASYREAVARAPDHGAALNNLAALLEEEEGNEAEAEQAYRRAIAINPDHSEALNNLGSLLSKMGRVEEARALFERSLAIDPMAIASHHNLTGLKKYTPDDPNMQALESLVPQAPELAMPEKAQFYFTWGRALDDCGRFDEAFAAFAEGNRLKHAELAGRAEAGEKQMAAIETQFTAERIEALSGRGCEDETPVFIVGMPRSGTTLIEQILASHSGIHGAGELKDLNHVIGGALGTSRERPFVRALEGLESLDFAALGEAYVAALKRRAPGAARITDKMPANFHHLGFIYLALPNARVIHAARDPMDSCLSCYQRLFNEPMAFAYDLETLGRYYVRYHRLMSHWREVLPEDFILEMPYDQVVEDVEGQTRRMLEFVGLPFEESCLKFYENDRPVRTASLAQVRKPIYKSSVARWKRFEKHLGPLYEIVKDYRPGE
jgi:tetratricopeptide (TPR) repeat protein